MNNQEAIEAIKSNYPTSGYEMLKEALNMAIDALEKQIPKRVISCECQSCGTRSTLGDFGEFYKYCGNCGRKLDWSEMYE